MSFPLWAGARAAHERVPLHLAKGRQKEGRKDGRKEEKTFTVAKNSLKIQRTPSDARKQFLSANELKNSASIHEKNSLNPFPGSHDFLRQSLTPIKLWRAKTRVPVTLGRAVTVPCDASPTTRLPSGWLRAARMEVGSVSYFSPVPSFEILAAQTLQTATAVCGWNTSALLHNPTSIPPAGLCPLPWRNMTPREKELALTGGLNTAKVQEIPASLCAAAPSQHAPARSSSGCQHPGCCVC